MRRVITLFLAILLIAMLAVPAYAAGAASYIVSKTTAYRGDTVVVTIFVSGFASNKTGKVQNISYDSTQFEFVSGVWTDAVSGAMVKAPYDGKTAVFSFASAQKIYGNIFQATFKVKSNAPFKSSKISMTLTIDNQTVKFDNSVNVTVACKHTYNKWANWSATHHHRQCTTCWATQDLPHTYDNPCDTTCNDCGATRTTTHEFAETWTKDETGHWHACTKCGEKSDFAEHIPGAEATEEAAQTCTECEQILVDVLEHVHRYEQGEYEIDKNGHWQICLGCHEPSEPVEHIYDNSCDDVCNDCEYQRRVLHNESDQWISDAHNHWKDCPDCDVQVDLDSHIWDGGTATKEATLLEAGEMVYECGVCHATKTVIVPKLGILQGVPWWGWLAAGVFGGWLVTFTIMMIVISVKAKKNSKGKFVE